ncbi:MAG TPA: pyridoxamine 5'-phosphate oxidase family protein [Bryobacteraceae bacterium]|nr:pyridoxamine 5'-phosphate oxidase family protein [Bryobacteraceae bacterium]
MGSFTTTPRTTVRRLPKRGVFDRAEVFKILDEAFICHVGFCDESGRPVVIPTAFGRAGERIYLHGSAASRMLRGLAGGLPVCVTVTLVDALVLARSAFHHSIDYRSVVMFGEAVPVEDPAEKNEALRLITDHLVPGRWDDVRQPTDKELKATSVLALDLAEVSAKVRTGGPIDDEEDMELPVWAGLIPLRIVAGEPLPEPGKGEAPAYVRNYRRGL